MKRGNFRQLRYNIWLYFILYTILTMMAVWIMQILFIDSFYQKTRYNRMIETGNEISQLMNTDSLNNEKIDAWISSYVGANETGIYTYLVYFDENGNFIVESPYSHFLPENNKPTTNGPVGIKNSSIFSDVFTELNSGKEISNGYICDYYQGSDAQSQFCVYATKVTNPLGEFALMLVSANESLNESVSVIQYQLILVTAGVFLISFILSWIIANKLSEPIQLMSKTAKKWADGENEVLFISDSYYELNELADALNYAKEGIAKTGALQRDLLANVSHDLKTPLTMIKAYAEMIRDISGENKLKRDQHTNVIINEADRLTMLVNDILDLSKLQNNNSVTDMQQVNLSELIERVIYRFQAFKEVSGYKINSNIEPDLFTVCNEMQIEQVVYNLIGNSINYTGEDKTINVYLTKTGDKILLQIIDSGKGIPPEQIDGIWEKYYRFSETHQRPVKGTGLGLSIVKTILQNQKLKFGVISKKHIGSNFFVEFKGLVDDENQ